MLFLLNDNRARAVLDKMKQLFYIKHFHKNTDNENDDENENDINTTDDANSEMNDNTYATCMLCRCHIFNMIDIEEHDPRYYYFILL